MMTVRMKPSGALSWTRYSAGNRLISIMPSMRSPPPHARGQPGRDGELRRLLLDGLRVDPVAADLDGLERVPRHDRLLERALEGALEAGQLGAPAGDVDLFHDPVELVLEVVEG